MQRKKYNAKKPLLTENCNRRLVGDLNSNRFYKKKLFNNYPTRRINSFKISYGYIYNKAILKEMKKFPSQKFS